MPVALAGLGLAMLGCGGADEAPRVPMVGFLSVTPSPGFVESLQQGLRELGYVDGDTISIEWRITDNPDDLPGIATELVDLGVDLIIAGGDPGGFSRQGEDQPNPHCDDPQRRCCWHPACCQFGPARGQRDRTDPHIPTAEC